MGPGLAAPCAWLVVDEDLGALAHQAQRLGRQHAAA